MTHYFLLNDGTKFAQIIPASPKVHPYTNELVIFGESATNIDNLWEKIQLYATDYEIETDRLENIFLAVGEQVYTTENGIWSIIAHNNDDTTVWISWKNLPSDYSSSEEEN